MKVEIISVLWIELVLFVSLWDFGPEQLWLSTKYSCLSKCGYNSSSQTEFSHFYFHAAGIEQHLTILLEILCKLNCTK